MSLTARLAAAMIILVTATVAAVGWFSYRNLEQALLPSVLSRIESHSGLVVSEIQSFTRGARADISTFRKLFVAEGLVLAISNGGIDPVDHVAAATWRDRLARRLIEELIAKPSYSQFRLIGIKDDGREIVRVDRSGPHGAVRDVPAFELQQKSDRPYFEETIRMGPGDIYVSPITLNEEKGVIETPHIPTLRLASPVFTPDGEVFGIVIINVDMRAAFDRARSAVRSGGAIYVVNERGDYFVHPDVNREFAPEKAGQSRWQTDFPELASASGAGRSLATMIADRAGQPAGAALAPAVLNGKQWIGVIETIPNTVFMAPADAIRRASLLVGFVAILCAAGLAIFLARSLTKPIIKLTQAVATFGARLSVPVPIDAAGETGVLARAFSHAFEQTAIKTRALEQEIKEHRKTEAERDRHAVQERLFSAAVESSNDAIVTKSLDGTITGWNPAAERLFGFTMAEAVGKSIEIIVPKDRYHEMWDILARIGRGQKVEQHETVRVRKDGSLVEISLGISPIRLHSGEIIGASKTARDITQAKQARIALSESEQLAASILDTALDAFVQTDARNVITNWNLQAEIVFGWSRTEAVGNDLTKLIIPSSDHTAQNTACFMQFGQHDDIGRRREVTTVRKDGKEIQTELSITALRRREGFIFNGFFRDVTEKIAIEDRMRQTEKLEAIGQLTGGIAHDFNNILTVIIGTIEILAEAVKDNPQMSVIAKMIDEAAGRGADLTQHLLAFARKQPLRPQVTDVNALIVDTGRLLRPTLGEHIDVDSRFSGEACLALVDPSQLSTALLNLALNARDAMPEGGKLLFESETVYFDASMPGTQGDFEPGRYVVITVSDTGAGIPADLIDKVFEPFFTSKEIGKGTGLGLSMVYGFVKQSSGHVTITSNEGSGTTIKLYLPATTESLDVLDVEPLASHEFGDERILVVEDDRLVRDYVTTQLHSLGYTTRTASNAAEALSFIESGEAVDLIFTDLIMPGSMNGRQLADEIHKLRPGSRILFTSGYTEDTVIHEGRLDPDVLLLAKPYRKSELAKMVRIALAV